MTDKVEENAALEVVRSYKATFKGRRGKAVLLDMAKKAGLFSPPNSLEPQDLAHQAGKREVILNIISVLDMDYDEVLKLYTSTNLVDEGEDDD
jgi:hypothetical protein